MEIYSMLVIIDYPRICLILLKHLCSNNISLLLSMLLVLNHQDFNSMDNLSQHPFQISQLSYQLVLKMQLMKCKNLETKGQRIGLKVRVLKVDQRRIIQSNIVQPPLGFKQQQRKKPEVVKSSQEV
jgi:hypothetical protein